MIYSKIFSARRLLCACAEEDREEGGRREGGNTCGVGELVRWLGGCVSQQVDHKYYIRKSRTEFDTKKQWKEEMFWLE